MASFQTRLNFALVFSLYLLMSSIALADDSTLSWSQLNNEQRQVLNPLASEWDTLRPWQHAT